MTSSILVVILAAIAFGLGAWETVARQGREPLGWAVVALAAAVLVLVIR